MIKSKAGSVNTVLNIRFCGNFGLTIPSRAIQTFSKAHRRRYRKTEALCQKKYACGNEQTSNFKLSFSGTWLLKQVLNHKSYNVAELIVSLQAASIRGAAQTDFPALAFDVRKGEHWAFTGANELLKTALLEALAGNRGLLNATVRYPLLEAYCAKNNTGERVLSPQQLIQFVSFRHPFRSLSNTTDFYYQQRFNSSDSENSLTVAEYLASLHLVVRGPVWTFEKVCVALKLQPLLEEKLIKLSNGETKRVLLAAALLRNPVLLVLHNPLAGLDVASRREITSLLNEVARCGTTLIMATSPHDVPEAITHVAVVTEANKLTAFSKGRFHPDSVAPAAVPPIDMTEVNSLLSIRPMSAYKDIICMKNVSIRYGDKLILDNINWTVKQGEHWALTGPNGSGKSTLLSLITGDNPQAFANDMVLFDRQKGSGESIWDIKKKIGAFSPELYQYFPVETSCVQAVESGFYDTIGLFRPSQAHTAGIALRWMKLLHLDGVAPKPLRQVAPVQQRLCLLARALVKSPVLLVLDEPCQGFDVQEQAYFRQLIDAVCALRNLTLIYVSHYREELPECITKQLRLQNGRQVD